MFEIGDKVVCIKDDASSYLELKKHNTYTIKKIGVSVYPYILIEEIPGWYHLERFISLVEYRKNKILKIKQRICLK